LRERACEVGRDGDLARLGIEFDVDFDLVARGDPCRRAVLCAERHEAASAHRRDCCAVAVATDRHVDRRTLTRTQCDHDRFGNDDRGRGLAPSSTVVRNLI